MAVKRPVATSMFFLAVVLLGLVSLKLLPLDIMPDMELPSLTVITVYPGASAEEVEQQVSKELERVLAGTEHLKEIRSSSKENVSFVSMQFAWGTDITTAANNARDLIELVKSKLPEEARAPIIYKVNSAMMPVLIYGITAKENYPGIEKIIEDEIAGPVRKVDGVGTVLYLSQPEREISVQVDPQKLQAYHMSIQQISTILKAENVNIPGGNIKPGISDFAVRIPGEFGSVKEIGEVALSSLNGKVIRLKDVATVNDGFAQKEEFARTKNGLGVAFMVQKQSGVNTLDVIRGVRAKMEKIRQQVPADVDIFEILSTDEVITQSIGNLTSSLWWALLFVTLVVLAFLREWKSSFIIVVTIPVSLIVAFITMFIIGYTINIFSLMALVIAIGMVVDNAIVVLENITQHIEQGEKPLKAAVRGTSEMGMAISASTATTLVVFIPMIFMGGVVGIMFKQLAVLTATTIIASLITALTLTPMMSSLLLKEKTDKTNRHGRFFRWSEQQFVRLEGGYKKLLGWAIHNKALVLVVAVLLFLFSLYTGKQMGTDYIPEFDAGDVAVVIETEVGTSAAETDRVAQQVMQIFREEVPEMVPGSLASVAGQTKDGTLTTVGFSEGKNVATILCHLVLPDKRERSAKEIGEVLRKRIAKIPEIGKFHVTAGSVLSAALLGNKKPIEVNISGSDLDELNMLAGTLKKKFEATPGFTDISTTADDGKLEIQINIDRQKAAAMGLNTAMVGMQIRQSLYGAASGTYTEKGDDYNITVRYAPEYRNRIEQLKNITVTNLLGRQVPLHAFASINEGIGSLVIRREAQQRVVTVKADLAGISLGEGTEKARKMIAGLDVPAGVETSLGGQVKSQDESFNSLYLILVLGILLVYMVMAAQFESFKYPFVVMFAVPLAVIGIIWAFKVTGLTLSVTTFIGVIMLMGIVVNNGIVLVDYTNQLRGRGYTLQDAVMEAGRSRMRPVLMTTFTTILGMLPMALSTGMGREMYSPLGITIIGGLLVSMLITLVVVPVIYASMSGGGDKVTR